MKSSIFLPFFQEFCFLGCYIDVTKSDDTMKRPVPAEIPGIEKDEQIKKMFDAYRKETNCIVVFFILQFVLLLLIF